jgi:transposase
MFDPFSDLNPKFHFVSPVHAPIATRCDMTEHVDRAIIALDGRAPFAGDCCVELMRPVGDAAALRIELWVNDLDEISCTYGFLVTSEDGHTPFARGERIVVNVDPASHRPEKWSPEFRHTHEALLKDLPAYA